MGIPTLLSETSTGQALVMNITANIDSTYDEYMFVLVDIGITDDSYEIVFNASIDGGSNYNVDKTTTHWYASHNENDGETQFQYATGWDVVGTGNHTLTGQQGAGADESASGIIHLYSPANTTYVKHFTSRIQVSNYTPRANDHFTSGYFNTTSAIDAVSFLTTRLGNSYLDGTIQLYGIS
tara:strand:- start:221 stop:763 length:543 start_codon:yes stop_codon:yes gene_type:complete